MKEIDFCMLVVDILWFVNIFFLEGVVEYVYLEIDGINFILMDGVVMEEGSFVYFCDFGFIFDNVDCVDILQCLLECNLLMFGVGILIFLVNFEIGYVMLMGCVELLQIDVFKLVNVFVYYVVEVR